jgi:arginine N-succinyltransferase
MLIVRPGKLSDLDQLERMARSKGPILHSLPADRTRLQELILRSIDSLQNEIDYPGEESYLFVLEENGVLYGSASIVALAGQHEPFYAFRNEVVVHASRELHVNHRIHALVMSHELTSCTRLTGFYIEPEKAAYADLLSRARLLFIAQHRQRFSKDIFSVLPGIADADGHSPFWESVGRKFTRRDFAEMERESGGRSRGFIAEVMPVDPLYVPLLSEDAQRVMGEPHASARLPYQCHLDEGFEPDRFIDIFDAGPILTATLDACYSLRHSALHRIAYESDIHGTASYLVCNASASEFRCIKTHLPKQLSHDMALPPALASALEVGLGSDVRCVKLNHSGAAL